jgi:hypothetical protein
MSENKRAEKPLPEGVDEADRALYELLAKFDDNFIRGQPPISGKLLKRIRTPLALHFK